MAPMAPMAAVFSKNLLLLVLLVGFILIGLLEISLISYALFINRRFIIFTNYPEAHMETVGVPPDAFRNLRIGLQPGS